VIIHKTGCFHFILYDFKSSVFGFTLLQIIFWLDSLLVKEGFFVFKVVGDIDSRVVGHGMRVNSKGMLEFEWNDASLLGFLTGAKVFNGTLNSLLTMISIRGKEESFKVELGDR